MKAIKIIIIAIFLSAPRLLFAQADTCTIKGTIINSKTAILVDLFVGDDKLPIERFICQNKFQFKQPIFKDSMQTVMIRFTYVDSAFVGHIGPDRLVLYLSAGEILITINDPQGNKFDYTLTGPEMTMEFNEKLIKPLLADDQVIKGFDKELSTARKNEPNDTLAIKAKRKEVIIHSYSIRKKYIKENPSSALSIKALIMMNEGDPSTTKPLDELQELFKSLSDKIKNSSTGKKYENQLQAMIKKGN